MVLKISSAIGAIIILLACTEPKSSETKTAGQTERIEPDGDALFLNHCASCHGVDGKLGLSNAKDLSKSTLTSEEVLNIILKGKNDMPPFEHLVTTDAARSALVKKVKSLKE